MLDGFQVLGSYQPLRKVRYWTQNRVEKYKENQYYYQMTFGLVSPVWIVKQHYMNKKTKALGKLFQRLTFFTAIAFKLQERHELQMKWKRYCNNMKCKGTPTLRILISCDK